MDKIRDVNYSYESWQNGKSLRDDRHESDAWRVTGRKRNRSEAAEIFIDWNWEFWLHLEKKREEVGSTSRKRLIN